MQSKIVSIGLKIPNNDIEEIQINSKKTLLDADIIIFQPEMPQRYSYLHETYQGLPCYSDNESFKTKEALTHWRRELSAALDAGKVIFLFLSAPEIVYIATGNKNVSGTGRNARVTRIVEPISSHYAIPTPWEYHVATGTEMTISPDAKFLTTYWSEFSKYSRYELYISGEIKEPLIKSKSGTRIVSACHKKSKGTIVALPTLNINYDEWIKTKIVKGEEVDYWSSEAVIFGKKLASTLSATARTINSQSNITPPPSWTTENIYRISKEIEIENKIKEYTEQILDIEKKIAQSNDELQEICKLRRLLFEQGKLLEHAVLDALVTLGFSATGFQEKDSEFDVVFNSEEGRFIGEVEGKDTRSINIDKFSQLERNINEDFARDAVSEYAKGILFGNAFRLKPIEEREVIFTEKCHIAAKRLQVALISTPDLFNPCRYLLTHDDPEYAKKCREAIFNTSGDIVKFPTPPENAPTKEQNSEQL